MRTQRWARLHSELDVKIRRGAWYRVLELGPRDAVLEVNRHPVRVPRQYLRLSHQPPLAWAVVPRPSRSPRMPPSWGEAYVVCPACRERAPLLEGRPPGQRCQRCNGYFEIAWQGDRAPPA